MSPYLEVALAITAIVAAMVGYFGRRLVEKSGDAERVHRAAMLLELHRNLKEQGATLSDLDDLERALAQKRPRLRLIEDAVQVTIDVKPNESPQGSLDVSAGLTQAEMNAMAAASRADVKVILDDALEQLRGELSGNEAERLARSQEQWERYAESQSTLAAGQFEGGSMQPLVYWSEMERLTVQRIAELKDYLTTSRL